MKKLRKEKTLSRDFQQRKALLNTLTKSLVEHKKITTTLAKAKFLRPYVEKRLTHAIVGINDAEKKVSKIRTLSKDLPKDIVKELFEIAKLYKSSNGGYLRIIKLPNRRSDAAKMAVIEWTKEVEKETVGKKNKAESKKSEGDKKENTSKKSKK